MGERRRDNTTFGKIHGSRTLMNEATLEAQNCCPYRYIYIYIIRTTLCSDLGNHHFQNAARGPLKYVGPGPSAPHFENVHFEKRIGGGDPT